MQEIRQRLSRLRKVADVSTDQLSGQDRLDFQTMKMTVNMVLPTKEYAQLNYEVLSAFDGLKVQPGTVGGYFLGCTGKNLCSQLCTGSMPRDNETCEEFKVITAKNSPDGLRFTLQNPESTSSIAILYSPVNTLNVSEKNRLRELGITRVKFSEDDQEVDLEDIPRGAEPRWERPKSLLPEEDDQANPVVLFLLISLLTIILIAAFTWR